MAHRINAYTPDGLLATVSNGAFRVDYLYTPDRLDAGYVVTTAGGVEIARHVTRDTWRRHLVTGVSNEVDGVEVRAFSYAYDALGRPVSRSGDAFLYNARSEVAGTTLGGVGAAYAYDAAGNRTAFDWGGAASAYAANGLNQYASVVSGGATNVLVHDAWGNLTDTRHFSFSFAYAENLPVGIRTNRTSGATSLASYYYDGLRRRVSRNVSPPGGQSHYHRYYYSGWSLQLETARNNAPYSPTQTSYYVWGRDLSGTLDGAGGVGGLLATEVDGTWYFPLYDNNGNVTDYVSETGEVVASYAYDAFGRTLSATGSMASVFPFRFSTKYYDAETGLYYYGYRYYSRELGRWITRDPIEEDGGDNLYAFCGNNSLVKCDFMGCSDRGTVEELKAKYGACYILTIKVDAKGFNYTDAQSLIDSMRENAVKKGEKTVGHTWIRLEDVKKKKIIEGGHSGETKDPAKNPKIINVEFLSYGGGISFLAERSVSASSPMPSIPEADPRNPIRWLNYIYEDGYWQLGDGNHNATSELSISITRNQFKAAKMKVDNLRAGNGFRLRRYGLTGRQCTSTAAEIAMFAGVSLDPFITLTVPSEIKDGFNTMRMWSDSIYQTLRFALPDKMQEEIKNWHGGQDHVFR